MISADGILCIFFFLLIAVWKLFVRSVLTDIYLRARGGTNLPEPVKIKLRLSFYKLQFFVSAVCMGAFVLYKEQWALKHDMCRIPLDSIAQKFRVYYIYEICFYLNELVTIFTEPRKKDFAQLVLHHVVSVLLLYLSFSRNFIKYGMLTLFLHDISHPLLEFSKIENYLKCEMSAEIGFFVFMAVFMISRLLVFPRYLVWGSACYLAKGDFGATGIIISVLLVVLQAMHIVWSKYILTVLMRIINGEKPKDTRE